MATAPAFAATVNRGSAVISTANTNRDGTGTLGTILTAGASGARVDEVRIVGLGTTTAGMVRLYASDGTNHRLIAEQTIAAATPSGTVPAVSYVLTFNNLLLKGTETLRASTHNAESFAVTAFGGDF